MTQHWPGGIPPRHHALVVKNCRDKKERLAAIGDIHPDVAQSVFNHLCNLLMRKWHAPEDREKYTNMILDEFRTHFMHIQRQ